MDLVDSFSKKNCFYDDHEMAIIRKEVHIAGKFSIIFCIIPGKPQFASNFLVGTWNEPDYCKNSSFLKSTRMNWKIWLNFWWLAARLGPFQASFCSAAYLPGLKSQRSSALFRSGSEIIQFWFSAVHYLKISKENNIVNTKNSFLSLWNLPLLFLTDFVTAYKNLWNIENLVVLMKL